MSISKYQFPTLIFSGTGARKEIISFLKEKNIKRPLLVTDQGLVTLPIFKNYFSFLQSSGFDPQVYSGVKGNPVESQVIHGTQSFHEQKADAIIGFGGGAALDVAKAIALMTFHPGNLFDYEDGLTNGRPVDQKIPPLFALPTTAGTGSEVGRSSVISDDLTHQKKIIFSPRILPKVVFADPELTQDLPSQVTATTGLDALTHLIEAFLAQGEHPICDGIALEGIRLVSQSLETCVKTPHHLQARKDLLDAAMMGAIAFQKGLGLVHSCAHSLSTVCDLHHGLANGIMLPFALEHNLSAVPEKFTRMANAAGLSNVNPEDFLSWIRDLKTKVQCPTTLCEVGVDESHLEKLVEFAFTDGCHPSGPRPVTKADFENIFKKALR